MTDKNNVLILSVGGSPEPLIYSIKEFKPDIVCFIHTPQTKKECKLILDDSGFDGDVYYTEISDHESLDNSFIKSKELFSNFVNPDYEVRVDFTGGTKPMVSGIVLAVIEGNFSNFRLNYVGSKGSDSRTKKGVGVVKDGSEISKLQINPYKKYAINEFKRGINFFNKYQFEAAVQNFEKAKEVSDDVNLSKLADIYIDIVNFYSKWDKFNDKISKNVNVFKNLNSIIRNIESDEFLLTSLTDDYPNFYNQLKNNLKFLCLKINGFTYEDFLSKNFDNVPLKNRIKYYLPDILNNAYRRIEEGKYDDALARLYRSSELIAQIKLTEIGLIDDDSLESNKIFHINRNQFLEKTNKRKNSGKIRCFIEDVIGEEELYSKKTFKLANYNSYKLLSLFGYVAAEEYVEINKKLGKRNNSILAHGLNPISRTYTVDLYDELLEYAYKFYPDLNEYMDLSRFPKFD